MKAAEDFIEIVLESHILTAAKRLLSINPNYSLQETCKMIVDNFVILTPQSQDEKHSVRDGSRFVNTQGRRGCNVPCDLHIEHLNRRLKGIIKNMGSGSKICWSCSQHMFNT